MSLSIRDLVRILCAGGSFVSGVHEAGFYIIAEDKNELSELRWVGSQLASETFIGSGVRNKSPAVYVTRDNYRSVFCVGENNALKCFTLGDEWQEIKLSNREEIILHPLSKLSGSVHGNDSLVFFDDKAGHLRGFRIQESGNWELLPFAPVDSVPGSPHFTQVRDNTVFLSYVHQDGYIHQRAIDVITNNYTDLVVKGTEFANDPANSFILGVLHDSDFQVIALTKEEQLVSVDGEGKRNTIGSISEKGVYTPSTSEESNKPVIKTASAAVSQATSGKKKRR
ncbi:hypothetical protein THAR02_07739 [Trichoderma harzianum]|uniref:Uncharacterized protein n=1 Tax=Trichoderma harzianum TaxID=5544 RepID=A0A0F9X6F9_TRIHA|nr:hypothetical protein THAR02_07739 [Trichoderma harzianum]